MDGHDPKIESLLARARSRRAEAEQEHARVCAAQEQWLVDAAVQETRRALLRELRRGTAHAAAPFLDDYFLAIADRPTLAKAITQAAAAIAPGTSADLQIWQPQQRVLRILASVGFATSFLDYFATVPLNQPTACTTAWTTRTPVLVDDVAHSPIFRGQPARAALLDAGSRAVYSYPLIDRGQPLGVLSFHNRNPLDQTTPALIARRAAHALRPLGM